MDEDCYMPQVDGISLTGICDTVNKLQDDLIKVVETMEDLSFLVNRLNKRFAYLDEKTDDINISIQYLLKELRKNELYKLRNKED